MVPPPYDTLQCPHLQTSRVHQLLLSLFITGGNTVN